jgi:hypothetical protein
MRFIILATLAALLAGCSSTPQKTLTKLDMNDPKFNSPECSDIRARALTYDDKIGERMAVGLVSGLLLGPFGLPLAASADARQEEERRVFNREITLRCYSNGQAIVAQQDAERETKQTETMTRQDAAN